MLFVFQQLKQWVYTHLNLSYRAKRLGPQTRCVVQRPVVGWDVGYDYTYHLDGAERQVWEVSDPLVYNPPTIEVSVAQEIVEQTWEWEWEESSDSTWMKLMYHFAVVEDSRM